MYTDEELIEEIKKRFDNNNKAIHDLKALTKKLEEVNKKLLESESLKSNFLSNIRNEINNPLTSIMLISLQLAHNDHLNLQSIRSKANMMYSEAFNLNYQLRNIFVAAEIEAGETSLSLSNINIDSLVQGTIDLLRQKADEKKVTITYLCDVVNTKDVASTFKADSDKLQLVFINLLMNAIEYSYENGLIELELTRDNGLLKFTVKDQGIGIDITDQKIIFDRFKQLDAGVKKGHRGHGLGLSITKDLVELMGGTITVISGKGKGSVFEVSLPEIEPENKADDFAVEGNVFIFEKDKEF